MEAKVSEVLENILGLLALEGSFEVEEKEEGVFVFIETEDAGKLIGRNGETLQSLQLLVNQIISRQVEESKRVIIDVADWRRSKEEELAHKAREWAQEVIETKKPMELEPMPAWQRRIVHMTIEQTEGVVSESAGEGADRHLVISPADGGSVDQKVSELEKSDEIGEESPSTQAAQDGNSADENAPSES